MDLYKLIPNFNIASKLSNGIFRFYELTKYLEIEDEQGRADPSECEITFLEDEYYKFPEKLPVAKFNGFEFKCISMGTSKEHIKQYFVFCMTTELDRNVMKDSDFAVRFNTDMFAIYKLAICHPEHLYESDKGHRFFTHGPIEYYDIRNVPGSIEGSLWKEVYAKHSMFAYQREYRAAFFASDYFFNRAREKPVRKKREIYKTDGSKMDFDLEVVLSTGIDSDGWRYIEMDTSEFSKNICNELNPIFVFDKSKESFELCGS